MTENQFDLEQFVIKPDETTEPQLMYFYGPPGGGKSYLAASAAEVEGLYPVLIIDVEGSTQGTLKGLPSDRIDIIRPQELDSVERGQEYPFVMYLLHNMMEKGTKYKTVIIDTADVFFELGLDHHHKAGDGFHKWNMIHSDLTSPPTRNDYGLFHRMKTADFLSILVVHEKKETKEDGTSLGTDFMWQGQGKAKIGGIPDFIGYITRDTNAAGVSKSTLSTAPSRQHQSKNRFGLPAKMENPSMQKIYDLIREDSK